MSLSWICALEKQVTFKKLETDQFCLKKLVSVSKYNIVTTNIKKIHTLYRLTKKLKLLLNTLLTIYLNEWVSWFGEIKLVYTAVKYK